MQTFIFILEGRKVTSSPQLYNHLFNDSLGYDGLEKSDLRPMFQVVTVTISLKST